MGFWIRLSHTGTAYEGLGVLLMNGGSNKRALESLWHSRSELQSSYSESYMIAAVAYLP